MNNGANGFTSAAPDNAAIELLLESALEEVDSLRQSMHDHLAALRSLSAKLKQAQREHRVNLREFQSVRQTLRTLKSVKI